MASALQTVNFLDLFCLCVASVPRRCPPVKSDHFSGLDGNRKENVIRAVIGACGREGREKGKWTAGGAFSGLMRLTFAVVPHLQIPCGRLLHLVPCEHAATAAGPREPPPSPALVSLFAS